MNCVPFTHRPSRRGYLLAEVLVAAVVVMTLAVLSTQMLRASAGQRASLRHRQAAMEEAANVMERIAARPWAQLTPDEVRQERLSDDARQMLLDGELSIELLPQTGLPGARQVLVTVSWREGTTGPRAVRLAAWRYENASASSASKEGRP